MTERMYEYDRASITLNGKTISNGPCRMDFGPMSWERATGLDRSASGDYTATCVIQLKPNAALRRFDWRLRHMGARARRRQPHPNRVKRERARMMRLAERVARDMVGRFQGMSALDPMVTLVGLRLGAPRHAGETAEAYRERLLATGDVLDIQPDRAQLAGVVKFVTCEIGFTA